MREGWRSVLIQTGVPFVEMAGTMVMLQWFVINLVMDEMVIIIIVALYSIALRDNFSIYYVFL
jgi:hypothetical protein